MDERRRRRIDERTPVYGADLETDNDGCGAWIVQWSVSNGEREIHGPVMEPGERPDRSTARDDLYAYLLEMLDAKDKCVIYFHNLRYDLQFLRSILWSMQSDGLVIDAVIRMGSPISVTIGDPESGHVMVLRDSAKKLPGTLRALAKAVGMDKLESPRGTFVPGWSADLDLTEDSSDWEYIDMDARIPAAAMRRLHSQGRTRATASGDAWHFAKQMLNVTSDGRYSDKWSKWFPKLSWELDSTFRRGYDGGLNLSRHLGLCTVEPVEDEGRVDQLTLDGELRHVRGTTHGEIITHEDVHSMYPTVLKLDPLPVGLPTLTTRWPSDRHLWIGELRLKLHLKPGCIPWKRFKNQLDNILEGWSSDTLIEDTEQWHQVIVTSVDLCTISYWYDIEFDDSFAPRFWIFAQETGLLADYVDYWFTRKAHDAKGSIEYVSDKLMLNSLYGRFALSPEVEEARLAFSESIEDYDFMTESGINEDNDAYLPMAMFITAHARRRLLENVMAVGPENVIHSDTDSVIHFGPPSDRVSHEDTLGGWGIESQPVMIYEGGFKRYIEILRTPIRSMDDLAVACAGVPQQRNQLDVPVGMWVELLDDPRLITATGHVLGQEHYRIKSEWLRKLYLDNDMNPDDVNTMKLIPRKVPGGVILDERRHALTDNMIRRMRML